MLANYLVSSNKFEHPTSRRPLTKEECAALDEYCKRHRLGCGVVHEALLEKERLEDPSERVRMLREQASLPKRTNPIQEHPPCALHPAPCASALLKTLSALAFFSPFFFLCPG